MRQRLNPVNLANLANPAHALNSAWRAKTVPVYQNPNPGNPVNRANPAHDLEEKDRRRRYLLIPVHTCS